MFARARRFVVLFAAALLGGCVYGFAGGGLPRHVKTVAVIPFENQTPLPDLQRDLNEPLRAALEQRLGIRDAAEDRADAIVRGTIVRFDPDAPVAFSTNAAASTSIRRRLQIVVDVEIYDQVTGRVLWQKKGISAEGEYTEDQAPGRKQAIDRIINDIIEGAQSQW